MSAVSVAMALERLQMASDALADAASQLKSAVADQPPGTGSGAEDLPDKDARPVWISNGANGAGQQSEYQCTDPCSGVEAMFWLDGRWKPGRVAWDAPLSQFVVNWTGGGCAHLKSLCWWKPLPPVQPCPRVVGRRYRLRGKSTGEWAECILARDRHGKARMFVTNPGETTFVVGWLGIKGWAIDAGGRIGDREWKLLTAGSECEALDA